MLTTLTTTPTTLTLGLSPVMVNLLVGGFLLVSIVMILIVLIQRPQGGGLGGAFGAGGGGGGGAGGAGQTAFGTKTGDVLTWATIGIFVLFLLLAIVLNFVTRPQSMAAAPTMTSPDAPASQQGGGSAPAEDPEESGSGERLSDEPITPDTDQSNDQGDGASDAGTGEAPSDDAPSDGTTRAPGSTDDDG